MLAAAIAFSQHSARPEPSFPEATVSAAESNAWREPPASETENERALLHRDQP